MDSPDIQKFSFRSQNSTIHVYTYFRRSQISLLEVIDSSGRMTFNHPCHCSTEDLHVKRVAIDFNNNHGEILAQQKKPATIVLPASSDVLRNWVFLELFPEEETKSLPPLKQGFLRSIPELIRRFFLWVSWLP